GISGALQPAAGGQRAPLPRRDRRRGQVGAVDICRHPRESRGPGPPTLPVALDSRFRGNDGERSRRLPVGYRTLKRLAMDFLVPKLSATMESATVLRWLKEAGQKVRMGEPLVELETDKAAIEVEAPADGTLESILAPEGTQLPIGAALGRLATSG